MTYERMEMDVKIARAPSGDLVVLVAFFGFGEDEEKAGVFADLITREVKKVLTKHGGVILDGKMERTKQ